MAKIEEIQGRGADERWRAQRVAQKLDIQIQQLKVALSELDTVKPKRTTYTKKASVFFLEKRAVISKTKKDELEQKEKKRHAVGLELRNALNKTHNLS